VVIGDAMGGVWLGFLPGLRRKVLKMGKVTKKEARQNFSDVGLRPKKGRQIFLAAPFPSF
jgi:hypothetical protein